MISMCPSVKENVYTSMPTKDIRYTARVVALKFEFLKKNFGRYLFGGNRHHLYACVLSRMMPQTMEPAIPNRTMMRPILPASASAFWENTYFENNKMCAGKHGSGLGIYGNPIVSGRSLPGGESLSSPDSQGYRRGLHVARNSYSSKFS